MNYGVGKKYSVFLMSVREGAPYADALDEVSGMLDVRRTRRTATERWSRSQEIGSTAYVSERIVDRERKFFRAAMDFKSGLREKPELIKVYEKISRGIWSYKGFFELIDASSVLDGKRKVFKFSLKPVKKKAFGRIVELPHNRLVPTAVKVEVGVTVANACNAGRQRICTLITTFHFRKAAAA